MLCLFLVFRKCWRAPFIHQLAGNVVCQVVVRFLCAFVQISLIMLCILLKLNLMAALHVAYLVLAASLVGGIVCLYSVKYRCITNLMTMLFLGRSGRALLTTLLITTVVAGVVTNIWSNSLEMIRVFVCTTMIHVRLTKMKFELFTKPFLDQFDEAIQSREYLQTEVKRMTDFIHPAIEAMENPDPGFIPDNSTKQIEPKDPTNVTGLDYALAYREKLREQCMYQIKETQTVCYRNYSTLYTDCIDAVFLIHSYCDPLKVENYCNISKFISGSTPETFCDTTDEVPEEMGLIYRALVLNRKRIEDERQAGEVKFNVTNLPTLPGIEEIKDTAQSIERHLEKRRIFIYFLLRCLSLVDLVILVHLIFRTLAYYRHYVMDIAYDNIYLTDELREIDANRATYRLPAVFPLKHYEQDFYVDPLSKRLRRAEWFRITYGIVYALLLVLGISCLFFIDWVYYTGLDVVRENAAMNFTQQGSFNFTIQVNGTGLLARIIRDATKGMNFTEFLSMNETNDKCLPNPTLTGWRSYVLVYALAGLIIYMNVNLMFSQRMMSVICGHFFPAKHEMRVQYLYNQMLIRRRIYFEENLLNLLAEERVIQVYRMGYHKVAEGSASSSSVAERGAWSGTGDNKEGEVDKPLFEEIWRKFHQYFDQIQRLWGKGKPFVTCLVCQERENIAETGEFLMCHYEKCVFRYCSSCWQNLDEKCVVFYVETGFENQIYQKFMEQPAEERG